jgi:hypothetical protein
MKQARFDSILKLELAVAASSIAIGFKWSGSPAELEPRSTRKVTRFPALLAPAESAEVQQCPSLIYSLRSPAVQK